MGIDIAVAAPYATHLSPDRRFFPRFEVTLAGVCSIASGEDRHCRITDLSFGGARVVSESSPAIADPVVLQLPHVGLIDGRVARITDDGFAVLFEGSARRRRLRDYLVFVSTRRAEHDEARAFERIVPLRRVVEIRRADGRAHVARIIDVSRSGVALTTTVPTTAGEEVCVGATRAEIVRIFEGGLAARFKTPLPPSFDASVTL